LIRLFLGNATTLIQLLNLYNFECYGKRIMNCKYVMIGGQFYYRLPLCHVIGLTHCIMKAMSQMRTLLSLLFHTECFVFLVNIFDPYPNTAFFKAESL
jgi:hypothetical protein